MTAFDVLLLEIDGTGWYQRRLTYLLLCPIFFFVPFAFLNQIFVLHIPDHWCISPEWMSPETLNMTLEQWRMTFTPMELGPDFRPRQSQCKMYPVTEESLPLWLNGTLPPRPPPPPEGVDPAALAMMGPPPCENCFKCEDVLGWDYDQSEMYNTAVTDNDWVCDKQKRATDLFTLGVVGLIIGTGIFSLIADFYGRRKAFFISTALMIIFSVISCFVSGTYGAYVTMKILMFACMLPLFQSPLSITSEISTVTRRGLVIGWACIAWSAGVCVLPLIAWLINRWKALQLVCTVPFVFIFACYKIIPESPRWLISRGQVPAARTILEKVSETNKVPIPGDMDEKLTEMANDQEEKSYGFISLFSTWRLAINTTIVTIAFTSSAFVYYQLVINIGNMAGNIFLNMFLLGLVEGPGCAIGVLLADFLGRRWTHSCLLYLNAILFFVLMWVAYDPELKALVIFLCMWIKMNISGTFVLAYVQAMEVFPTQIRQSGIGFATLISQTISIGGPYVIYLGMTNLKLPYAIMFLVCLVGAVATMFLPETLNCKLPETIAEASTFGQGDGFFSFRPHGYVKPNLPCTKAAEDGEVVRDAAAEKLKEAEANGRRKASTASSVYDWNKVMGEVFDGPPKQHDVHPELVRELLVKHYRDLGESAI